MNHRGRVATIAGVAAAALAVTLGSSPATAKPQPQVQDPVGANRKHDLPNPLGDAQRKLREEAVTKLVQGEATTEVRGGQRVITLAGGADEKGHRKKSRYVSYPVEREESIFTILTDFGDQTDPRTGGDAGPVHNQIAEPTRGWSSGPDADNSTFWLPNFNKAHYKNMMFGTSGESFKDFYSKLSNGRFLAKGDVSDWVQVPYNEARYGSNSIRESDGYWNYIKDTAQAWFDDQKAQGKTDAEIADYLKQFDQVDRYDYDGDGNFNEPDGYIDHFQAIHAGEGEEAGGGAQGDDAIWSHRWYAYSTDIGKTGPDGNLAGGVPIGDTGLWIGDYTTEPENGGLGVFAHEFGHDLGLPDLYDTGGGENSTGFWTLMSSGSWLNDGGWAIGTTPGNMGAWEKLQLGWLDYQTVDYGQNKTVRLGPADRDARKRPQAIVVNLPDKTVTTDYNTPHSGSTEWWGGSADGLNSTLTRPIDLTGNSSASVSAWLWYEIESDYDYLYGEVSTDGGTSWTDAGDPITGEDGTSWAEKTWDLSPWAGQSVLFRFRYATDGGVHYKGPFIDDITVTADGTTVFSDDVESGDNGWTADGWSRMSGMTSETVPQYYMAENRVYAGYDATLQTGPYNFGWLNTKPNWVERFPYQNGLLVTFANGEYDNNNTSAHPGGGQILPVDARPANMVFSDGYQLSNRRQPFDATFGKERTDAVSFHHNGIKMSVPSRPGIPMFWDAYPDKYWTADNPQASTKVAGSGVKIIVRAQHGDNMTVRVQWPRS